MKVGVATSEKSKLRTERQMQKSALAPMYWVETIEHRVFDPLGGQPEGQKAVTAPDGVHEFDANQGHFRLGAARGIRQIEKVQ